MPFFLKIKILQTATYSGLQMAIWHRTGIDQTLKEQVLLLVTRFAEVL